MCIRDTLWTISAKSDGENDAMNFVYQKVYDYHNSVTDGSYAIYEHLADGTVIVGYFDANGTWTDTPEVIARHIGLVDETQDNYVLCA